MKKNIIKVLLLSTTLLALSGCKKSSNTTTNTNTNTTKVTQTNSNTTNNIMTKVVTEKVTNKSGEVETITKVVTEEVTNKSGEKETVTKVISEEVTTKVVIATTNDENVTIKYTEKEASTLPTTVSVVQNTTKVDSTTITEKETEVVTEPETTIPTEKETEAYREPETNAPTPAPEPETEAPTQAETQAPTQAPTIEKEVPYLLMNMDYSTYYYGEYKGPTEVAELQCLNYEQGCITLEKLLSYFEGKEYTFKLCYPTYQKYYYNQVPIKVEYFYEKKGDFTHLHKCLAPEDGGTGEWVTKGYTITAQRDSNGKTIGRHYIVLTFDLENLE